MIEAVLAGAVRGGSSILFAALGETVADAIRARFGADALTSARALRGKTSGQD